MRIRYTKMAVLPDTEPLFSEKATEIEIQDEAAGEFVVVRQTYGKNGANEIRIEPDEWPAIRDSIARMISECRPERRPE